MSSQLESELAHADILYPELVREVKRLRAREAALVAALENVLARSEVMPGLPRRMNPCLRAAIEAARAALSGQEGE